MSADDLNARQRRFVVAAFKAGPKKGDSFNIYDVGRSLGLTETEADDIARDLNQANPPVLVRLPQHEATLATGREFARLYIEQEAERRKACLWGYAKGAWAAMMSVATLVVIPLWVNHLDRKYQRIEEAQRQRKVLTSPTTPAAALPGPTTVPAP